MAMTNFQKALFSLAVVLVLLDQISKVLCQLLLEPGQFTPVMPGLDLLLVYNPGAAFSFLSEAGGWQRWILAGFSLLISVILVAWILRLPPRDKLLGLALAMILGGAVGNLIDRVLLGHVVDFISVYYGQYRFATFNLADSAISVGAVLMALDIVLDGRRKEGKEGPREEGGKGQGDVKGPGEKKA